MSKIYRPHEFAQRIGRSTNTRRRWDKEGRLKAKRMPSGQRYYDETEVRLALGGSVQQPRKTIAYCRVSGRGQQDDLQRQMAAMEAYCLHAGIAVDEGSTEIGGESIGVDKGCSEVLTDSEGEQHGAGLGQLLTAESDYLKVKNQCRAKLRAIAENTKNARKRCHIIRYNLGRVKVNRRAWRVRATIRNVVFNAVHAVVDKASTIAAEDLTSPIAGRKFGKNVNRRLAAWTKGVIADALETVSQRRGSTLIVVNAAYTSQLDSRYGVLLGRRSGDSFYCFDGVVLQADQNAAQNVQARLFDPEIDRWTPDTRVKSILLARTERHRLGLLNQDSSCNGQPLSTESELPEMGKFA